MDWIELDCIYVACFDSAQHRCNVSTCHNSTIHYTKNTQTHQTMKNKITIFLLSFCLLATSFLSFSQKIIKKEAGNNPKSINAKAAGCAPGSGSAYLEINNVRALIHTGGDMWWDLQGRAKYEIPKGSGKTALFAGGIWIGGLDANGQLRLAAINFRAGGVDFWPGPLITGGETQATVAQEICINYDKMFNIKKKEVEQFRNWYNADAATRSAKYPSYVVPEIIRNWPAHGPAGYDFYLAPFFDNNNDGIYNYTDGDYPYYDLDNSLPCKTERSEKKSLLRGDQTLWWVFNDKGNTHTETNSNPIGVEIRAQAFAYATNDALNDMTFYNYELINRSANTLYQTHFTIWSDADLGYAYDDYVGSDVSRGLGYVYNGSPVDGNGQPEAYGGPNPPPPAVGIDFFEGPYMDADGMDNISNRDENGVLKCDSGFRINTITGKYEYAGAGDMLNGNINGQNFGDNISDNERMGMRNFIHYKGGACNDMCNPYLAPHYYNYMRGFWQDGTTLKFGGTGHANTGIDADFLFPGKSDTCNWGTGGIVPPATNPEWGWSEKGEGNAPDDKRFVISTGLFTLEPGAVNDVTLGAVWARAPFGNEWESVKYLQLADDLAQRLFDVCFKNIEGTNAPELHIVEMDKQVLFHIWNKPASNNYMENFQQMDKRIICPLSVPDCDAYYRFQGYQVFQLADKYSGISDLYDTTKARLAFQCDVKDGVSTLVNYTWHENISTNAHIVEVCGADSGIRHSFRITKDLFGAGEKNLVNYRKYYFVAIAYAYNNYQKYNQNDPLALTGQKQTYLRGIRGAEGDIKIFEVIPHLNAPENGGTDYPANYGDGFEITQHEGYGNGQNNLELTEASINAIMAGPPWKTNNLTYQANRGPIKVKIIDPLNVPDDTYIIKMDSISNENYYADSIVSGVVNPLYGLIKQAKWYIQNSKGEKIWSDQWITVNDEKIFFNWGISVQIEQVGYPLAKTIAGNYYEFVYGTYILGPVLSNGVLESSLTTSDDSVKWLNFLPDQDGNSLISNADNVNPFNWIRSGSSLDGTVPKNNDEHYIVGVAPNDGKVFWDPSQNYEKILEGTWAPYKLASKYKDGLQNMNSTPFMNDGTLMTGLNSVDIVITPDKSKWTRCPVIEMGEDTALTIGDAWKFALRKSPSVDREGKTGTDEATANGTQPTGMGYFPGYVIDVETGERLNMMFGEDSWLVGERGHDMMFNPTSNLISSLGNVLFAGKHYIYILGRVQFFKDNTTVMETNMNTIGNYDEGLKAYTILSSTNTIVKRRFWGCPMWCSIPYLTEGYDFKDGNIPLTEINIKLRVAKPYRKGTGGYFVTNPQNNNFPYYSF